MRRRIIIAAATLVLLASAAGYFFTKDTASNKVAPTNISSFEQCAKAGYPVQTSFPEVCQVPNGKAFTKPAQ